MNMQLRHVQPRGRMTAHQFVSSFFLSWQSIEETCSNYDRGDISTWGEISTCINLSRGPCMWETMYFEWKLWHLVNKYNRDENENCASRVCSCNAHHYDTHLGLGLACAWAYFGAQTQPSPGPAWLGPGAAWPGPSWHTFMISTNLFQTIRNFNNWLVYGAHSIIKDTHQVVGKPSSNCRYWWTFVMFPTLWC